MYTIFNPWKGFPSAQAVYLDTDFQRMRANGQLAFGTAQTAYDAAVALGGNVVIMVGKIGAGTSGNITLTGDYNDNVSWVGLDKESSQIGNIEGNHAIGGAGSNIQINISAISFQEIDSSNTVGDGGNIQIQVFSPSDVDNISTLASSGSGGDVQIDGPITVGTLIDTRGAGLGGSSGDVSIGEGAFIEDIITTGDISGSVSIAKNCYINGNIDISSQTQSGTVEIGENTNVAGTISTFSILVGGNITLKKSCSVHSLVLSSILTGNVFSNSATIDGTIDNINGGSVFRDTLIVSTIAASDCIMDLAGDGAQFHNCIFISNLANNAINATVPRNIVANNTLQNTNFGVNVNVLVGNNNTTYAGLLSPL